MPNLPSNPNNQRTPWAKDELAEYVDQLKSRLPADHPARSAVATATSAGSGGHRGRLIFALDATASRQPTWDHACRIQSEMFEATAAIGGLDLQLAFYRGYDECRNSRWVYSASDLHRLMSAVSCAGGYTQIERLLDHAIRETRKKKVNALVFVGDAMEEKIDRLCHFAGALGEVGVPVFCFHEGNDQNAETAFRQVALLSRGAYCRFDFSSIDRLKELLGAVAVFATGNREALEAYAKRRGGAVLQLTSQLKR
jgi:hypothetical protein